MMQRRRLLVLTLLGALAFVLVAWGVHSGACAGLDRWGLEFLRGEPSRGAATSANWFDSLVRDVSALGSNFVLISSALIVLVYLALRGRPRAARFLLLVVATGMLLGLALKFGLGRARPDVVGYGTVVLTKSFPSAHAMNSALVYLSLALLAARPSPDTALRRYLYGLAVLLSLLVGLSRVYLGVHWPSDVLAGWIAGWTWVALCCALYPPTDPVRRAAG
jgi:undecaprenyl-diphosphatase